LEVTYSILSFAPSFGNNKKNHYFLLFNKVLILGDYGWSIRNHMVQKSSYELNLGGPSIIFIHMSITISIHISAQQSKYIAIMKDL